MPWCPKCKSEYREGFTICADCGSGLVEEEPVDELKKVSLFVPEEDFTTLSEPEDMQEWQLVKQWQEQITARRAFRGSSGYQDSSQRANENRSSAWVLLIVGSLGLVMVILGVTEVLPFKLENSYLLYGVMSSVFVLFVVAGVVSMKNARFFERRAESENSLRDAMVNWCCKNLSADGIDSEVGAQGVGEEEIYFRRTAYIRERLNRQFINLDQDFLDRFVDDHIYEMIFVEDR